jgi:hypothetical protein
LRPWRTFGLRTGVLGLSRVRNSQLLTICALILGYGKLDQRV